MSGLPDLAFLQGTVPQIPGLVFRPFAGDGDLARFAEITNASQAADGVEETISVGDVANEYAHLVHCDPASDVIVAEVLGESVAWGRVHWRITDAGERVFRQLGHVHPAWRRRGIGRAILRFTESRSRAIAKSAPHRGPDVARAMAEDTAAGKPPLFEQEGYGPLRYFLFMGHRDLDRIPDAPLPPGLELRAATPADLRAIWEAKEEAFRDHWGHVARGEVEYRRWIQDEHDLRLWRIAWDRGSGHIAGVALGSISAEDNRRFGFLRGWIEVLGVRRPWRGAGSLGRC